MKSNFLKGLITLFWKVDNEDKLGDSMENPFYTIKCKILYISNKQSDHQGEKRII